MARSRKALSASVLLLVVAVPARATEAWNYSLTPYLWTTAIKGTEGIAGRDLEVDAGFSDLLKVLDFGLAVHFEAQGHAWGWFGDVFYAKLSDERHLPGTTLKGDVK